MALVAIPLGQPPVHTQTVVVTSGTKKKERDAPMATNSNGKQNIPPLFKEIMKHHRDLDTYFSDDVLLFDRGKRLLRKTRDLRRAAEQALRWNTDKGNIG
jgi:hypothetical protein